MVLSLLSGVALFLFGMSLMGDGLKLVAGNKLEAFLYRMTNTPLKGVALGTAVTSVIQSSSATTVMVIGFVNSGMMKLKQAIGIIMGANIGTSITGWILCLSYIQGSGGIASILSTATISAVVAIIGIILRMFCKRSVHKNIGNIMLGFSILMTGMQTMSGAVAPLRESKVFIDMLTMFSNPLAGILVGILFTAVLQSASATVGVLQALSVTGILTFASAFPIVLGIGVGAACPVLISAIGANKSAKRAAMIHLYFNLIGTVVFMSLFYLINTAVHFPFMTQMATPATIAITHSVFNITATLVWLPFSNLLVKLACLTIRDDKSDEVSKEDQEFMILESRFLEKPAFAVEQGRNAARHMERDSRKALDISLGLLRNYEEEQAERVQKIETKVDRYEDELGTYLVKLNNKDLSEKDSHSVSIMLHCIGDFERISDHAVNIMESARELHEKNLSFSPEARTELQVLASVVGRIVDTAYDVFDKQDMNLTRDVEPLEEMVDELSREMKRRHVNRLRSGECTIEMGFILTDLLTSLERIADHCSNISVCVTQVRENLYDTHSHLESLKNEPDEGYYNRLEELQREYVLP